MIALFIVLISFAIYIAAGTVLGRRDVPRHLLALGQTDPILYDPLSRPIRYKLYTQAENDAAEAGAAERRRNAAQGWLLMWMFLWPFIGIVSAIRRALDGAVAPLDPISQRHQVDQMQRRIKELEDELDIQGANH